MVQRSEQQDSGFVTYSIHDSDISDFYRWIIGYKNLLRAVELAGKAGILGLEFLSNKGKMKPDKFERFLQYDVLRRSYINQTFNFVPSLRKEYYALIKRNTFEVTQENISQRKEFEWGLKFTVTYLVQFLRYTNFQREMVQGIADKISSFVEGYEKA